MVRAEDLEIFRSCIDLDIVKSYPYLSYNKAPLPPARARVNVLPRVRVPVAVVLALPAAVVPAEPGAVVVLAEPVAVVVQAEPVTVVVPNEPVPEANRVQPRRPRKHKKLVRPSWLPRNWQIYRRTRMNGISKGNKDMYYMDPYGFKLEVSQKF